MRSNSEKFLVLMFGGSWELEMAQAFVHLYTVLNKSLILFSRASIKLKNKLVLVWISQT